MGRGVIMYKTVVKVDGMMCGMCESHVNEAVRKAVSLKKVTSSHSKGITEIISENKIDEEAVKKAIDDTGYKVLSIETQPYEKRSSRYLEENNKLEIPGIAQKVDFRYFLLKIK